MRSYSALYYTGRSSSKSILNLPFYEKKRVFLTYTLDVKALSLSLKTINSQLQKVLA